MLSYMAIFSLLLVLYLAAGSALEYWQLNSQLYSAEVQDLGTVEGLLYFSSDGRLLLHDDYRGRTESWLPQLRRMQVMDSHGALLFRNDILKDCDLGGAPLPNEFTGRYVARKLRLCDGTPVLSVSHLYPFQGRQLLIRVAYSIQPLRTRTLDFLFSMAVVMPFALLVAGVLGYRLAGQALGPLEKMARTTMRITARRLSERIPIDNAQDEVGHMAQVLNVLLGRLEESFGQLKRFTSDVSHELRTPLASLRSVGEVGLQADHDAEAYREVIGSMLEEVAKLSTMIDTLLTMAHAESGEIELRKTDFAMQELVQESVALVSVLAEEKKQSIIAEGDGQVHLSADRTYLRMVLINLLDNAVKYSPVGSAIRVNWASPSGVRDPDDPWIALAVEDEGPGIPEPARQKVFDRFYRVDDSRARATGGAGLGLAIARWAVEAHGGTISLGSGRTGGALFTVVLPVNVSV
jgi:heavy metal sensor kinase